MPVADRSALDWRCVAAGTGSLHSAADRTAFALVTPFGAAEESPEIRLASTPWWAQWTATGPEQSLRGPGPITLVLPDAVVQTSVDDLVIDLRRDGATISISFNVARFEHLAPAPMPPDPPGSTVLLSPPASATHETSTVERDEPAVLPADSVSHLATRIKDSSQLTDDQLAEVFPGELARETFQRWRTGRTERPTEGNLRRLGLLHQLFEDLAVRVAEPRNWLLQFGPSIDGRTPYDLLLAGRFSEVQNLVASLPALAALSPESGAEAQALEPSLGPLPHDHTPDQIDFTAFADDEGDWVEADEDDEDAPG